ncbi:transcriptional regulator, PadR family [Calothrix sp. PCC 7716]|nr:transcriptional regulator, PadR family [Calothrix sp. PCC 7716]
MAKHRDNGVIILSALEEDLLTLLLGREPTYGLEILELLNQKRRTYEIPDLKIGSLYPTLKRMEEQKLITGEWGEAVAESTRRRYYKITADGEVAITRTQAYRRELSRQTEGQSIPDGKQAFGLSKLISAVFN